MHGSTSRVLVHPPHCRGQRGHQAHVGEEEQRIYLAARRRGREHFIHRVVNVLVRHRRLDLEDVEIIVVDDDAARAHGGAPCGRDRGKFAGGGGVSCKPVPPYPLVFSL